jgi:hypothetical protein
MTYIKNGFDKILPTIKVITDNRPSEGKKWMGSKRDSSILNKLIRATPQLNVCLKNDFIEVLRL